MRLTLTFLGFLAFSAPAIAEGERLAAVSNAVTKTECSACHMAYPPELLPARSWEKIMDNLPSHFGENATLPPATVTEIKDYLMAHAADAKGGKSRATRGLAATDTPLKISELPWFKREHGTFSPSTMARIGSASNCVACHKGAADGYFEDD